MPRSLPFRRSPLLFLLIPTLLLAEDQGVEHVNTLFQVSTLDALSLGIYQGALSLRALERQGDFGVGTFDSLDGEMIALDGRFFQVRSDGTVSRVAGDATTPFAAVTTFKPDWRLTLQQPLSYAQVSALIDQMHQPAWLSFPLHFRRSAFRRPRVELSDHAGCD